MQHQSNLWPHLTREVMYLGFLNFVSEDFDHFEEGQPVVGELYQHSTAHTPTLVQVQLPEPLEMLATAPDRRIRDSGAVESEFLKEGAALCDLFDAVVADVVAHTQRQQHQLRTAAAQRIQTCVGDVVTSVECQLCERVAQILPDGTQTPVRYLGVVEHEAGDLAAAVKQPHHTHVIHTRTRTQIQRHQLGAVLSECSEPRLADALATLQRQPLQLTSQYSRDGEERHITHSSVL
mmetsp:Transcript_5518/g.15371  ORF Transcript_5518/g.15371 Transcript_5518/m.15371 type:complete len:235 (+) Transcript_5518:2210-2914(+)